MPIFVRYSNAGCSQSYSQKRSAASTTLAVIGTLMGIGLLAAILFFVCKPEKRYDYLLFFVYLPRDLQYPFNFMETPHKFSIAKL